MGQCQSRSVPVGERHIVSKQHDGRGFSKPKLFISLLSPSNQSTSTVPETPSPQSSTSWHGQSPSVSPKLLSLEEEEEEKHQDVGFSIFTFAETPSLVGGVVGSAIEEEESLGAPSDEESFHETQKQKKRREEEEFKQQALAPIDNSGDAHPDSARRLYTPRSSKQQSQVKLLRSHVTSPKSIIHRPSLVAPPKGVLDGLHNMSRTSVNPHTIADFNKLKVQVQLARRAEKHRRRKAKLEDRLQDVQGYRDLWNAYEEIGQKVSTANQDAASDSASATKDARPLHERRNSLDLKQPSTWYFDFQGLEDFTVVDNDDEGYRSQSSLSLLSEASMEVQRRLFAEKRKSRRQKRPRKGHSQNEKRSDISVSSRNSEASSCRSDFTPSFDYGPGNSLTNLEVLVTDDENTPRARSRRKHGIAQSDDASRVTDDGSCCSDLDDDNDYRVPRRRRHTRHQADDSSLSTYDDRSYDTSRGFRGDLDLGYFSQVYATEERPTPTSIRVKKISQPVPTAKEQYGFDPSAPLFLQMETLNLPSVEIADAATGEVRWRQFPDSNNAVGVGHANTSLETNEGSTGAFQLSYRTAKDTINPKSDNLDQDLHCLVGPMSTRKTMGIVDAKSSLQIPQEQAITECLTHDNRPACSEDQVARVAGREALCTPYGNRDPIGSAVLHRSGQDDAKWAARRISRGQEPRSRTLQSSPRNRGDKNESKDAGTYSPSVHNSKVRRSGPSETCGSLEENDPALDHLSTEQFLLISSPATQILIAWRRRINRQITHAMKPKRTVPLGADNG
jgi:hypothetical protein